MTPFQAARVAAQAWEAGRQLFEQGFRVEELDLLSVPPCGVPYAAVQPRGDAVTYSDRLFIVCNMKTVLSKLVQPQCVASESEPLPRTHALISRPS